MTAKTTKKTKKTSRLSNALIETADDMRRLGMLDRATHAKITLRHRRPQDLPRIAPLTGAQIRLMRARAKMSQAVFASHLNVTTGYLSQLERSAKRPTGAALALLNIIKRKGIAAIL